MAAPTTPVAAVPSSSSRLYRCSTCLLIFPCNDALNLHLTSHHLHPQNLNLNEIKAKDIEELNVNDENVFKCSICDKVCGGKVGIFWISVMLYIVIVGMESDIINNKTLFMQIFASI